MGQARVKWVRDEVILALDLLFNSENQNFGLNDKRIEDLSCLLQNLPIVPKEIRNQYFRNYAGVRRQILTFAWSLKKEKKASHVGLEFYRIFYEFENDRLYLHQIATAMKRCLPLFKEINFINDNNLEKFKEGLLLGYLHMYHENHYESVSNKEFSLAKCSICGIQANQIYSQGDINFIKLHLLIPPIEYREKMRFKNSDFAEVCPNCHRMLHLIRPWTIKTELKNILKTY